MLPLTLDGRRVVRESRLPLQVQADGVPRAPAAAVAARQAADRDQARGCTGLAAPPAR